jgi:hypothetical protein
MRNVNAIKRRANLVDAPANRAVAQQSDIHLVPIFR